jgi:hypothetical protein
MITTLREARAEARLLRQQGDFAGALSVYERILTSVPLDYEVRTLIADILVRKPAPWTLRHKCIARSPFTTSALAIPAGVGGLPGPD